MFARYMSIVILILFVFAIWSTRLADPLTGHRHNAVAQVVLASENYHHYGFQKIGLLHVFDADPTPGEPERFYVSIPGLFPLLTALVTPLWGTSIFSVRLLLAFLTLTGAVAFFQFLRRSIGYRRAYIGLAAYLLFPLVVYYGAQPVPDMWSLSGFSLLLLAYQSYIRRASVQTLSFLIASTLFLSLLSYNIMFTIPAVLLHALLFSSRRWQVILIMGLTSMTGVSIWFISSILVLPDFFQRWFQRFTIRTVINTRPPEDNAVELWIQIFERFRLSFSEVIFIILVSALIAIAIKHRKKLRSSTGFLFAMILFTGIAPAFVFPEAYYDHNYLTLSLVPGMAILCVVGLEFIRDEIIMNRKLRKTLRFGTVAMITGILVAGWFRWTVSFYNFKVSHPLQIGEAVQEYVPPGNFVYANTAIIPSTWYYSQRNFRDLIDIPEGKESEVYRLICGMGKEVAEDAIYVITDGLTCEFLLPETDTE